MEVAASSFEISGTGGTGAACPAIDVSPGGTVEDAASEAGLVSFSVWVPGGGGLILFGIPNISQNASVCGFVYQGAIASH